MTSTLAYDGDWTVAVRCGQALITYPFQNLGDVSTRIIRQPFQQDLRYRGPMPVGQQNNDPNNSSYNTAYAFDDSEPQDMGAYLGRWMRSYADLPGSPITTEESYNYSFQIYSASTTASSTQGTYDSDTKTYSGYSGSSTFSVSLSAVQRRVDSRVVREYYLASNEGNYPLTAAPKMIQTTGQTIIKIGGGTLFVSKTISGVFVSTDGNNFLAEDQWREIWHYPIKCRCSRYIAAPTDSFWANGTQATNADGTGGVGQAALPAQNLYSDFSASPNPVYTGTETTLTLTGINTSWASGTTTFYTEFGVISDIVINSATSATVKYTALANPQNVVVYCINGGALSVCGLVVAQGPTFTVSPASIVANTTGNFTLTGTLTNWTTSTTFRSKYNALYNVSVTSPTTATFTYVAGEQIVNDPITGSDNSSGVIPVVLFPSS